MAKSASNQVKLTLEETPPKVWRTNYRPIPAPGEINNMPSMTVPDQSMSLIELWAKFGSGSQMVNVGHELYYDGIGDEVDVSDDFLAGKHWDSLDLVEKHDILKLGRKDFTRINEGIAAAQKEKAAQLEQKRKQEAQDLADMKAYIKSKAANGGTSGSEA